MRRVSSKTDVVGSRSYQADRRAIFNGGLRDTTSFTDGNGIRSLLLAGCEPVHYDHTGVTDPRRVGDSRAVTLVGADRARRCRGCRRPGGQGLTLNVAVSTAAPEFRRPRSTAVTGVPRGASRRQRRQASEGGRRMTVDSGRRRVSGSARHGRRPVPQLMRWDG